MKRRNPVRTALLLFSLIIVPGLAACGDDDDDNGMTCEEALVTFGSERCVDAAEAAIPGVQDCVSDCVPPADPDCIEDCFDLDEEIPASCAEASDMLVDEENAVCGECFADCGDPFVDCVVLGGVPEDCLTQLGECMEDCDLP
jgi:hypothetical protein